MSSPLADYANASLTLPIETFGSWNPETLDYSKEVVELVYQIILEPMNKKTIVKDQSGGIDMESLPMKGRIVNPQIFDPRVTFPITGKVILPREGREGNMEISLIPQSPYYNEGEELGETFIGVLVYN